MQAEPSEFGPFATAYPPPEGAPSAAERARIAEHAEHLASGDRAWLRRIVNTVNGRRARAGHPEIALLGEDRGDGPPDPDFGLLVLQSELIARAESSPAVKELLDDQGGFTELTVPDELAGKVVRLQVRSRNQGVATLARRLRARGHAVSVNHVAPLNPWVKGRGGPENTARRPQRLTGSAGDAAVAVIDTGIACVDKVAEGWLTDVDRDGNVDELTVQGGRYLGLGAGHGTFACGLVAQAARMAADDDRCAARIVAYQALDVDGMGSEVDVAAAMVRAVRDGAAVLNLSLGTQTLDDVPPVAIQVALEIIEDPPGTGAGSGLRGDEVAIIAAAGNYGDARPCWPAAFKRVVAVGALDDAMRPVPFSSRGAWVDCSTVGLGVVSTFVEGAEDPDLDPDDPDTFTGAGRWASWYGTSFAAPQIAGLIARLCTAHGLKPREAVTEILRAGTRIPDFGKAVRILPGTR